MSKSNNKHLESIKDSISSSNKLTEEEKSSSFKLIEEQIAEDRALGTFFEKLSEISIEIDPILTQLGLK